VTRLDQFAPVWQFREAHSLEVQATPRQVYRAIREVTAEEIRFFRALTWLRRGGRAGPATILNPPSGAAILDVATRSGFLLLADDPDREVVVGTVLAVPAGARRPATPDAFRALNRPGCVKATMNFWIEPAESGARSRCVVTTETRVYAADRRTRRLFRVYWWLIHPGSALIRRMWLRAIRRRAEAARDQRR